MRPHCFADHGFTLAFTEFELETGNLMRVAADSAITGEWLQLSRPIDVTRKALKDVLDCSGFQKQQLGGDLGDHCR